MVQICTLSSTDVKSPNLCHAVTLFFLCSPHIPWNSVTQKPASICAQFLPSLDLLDLRSRPLKQLGLVITESVLTYLLSEHTASVKGWCQAVLCTGPLSKVSPGCGELCQMGSQVRKQAST